MKDFKTLLFLITVLASLTIIFTFSIFYMAEISGITILTKKIDPFEYIYYPDIAIDTTICNEINTHRYEKNK